MQKTKEYNPTHKQLVTRMATYFKNVRRATVVMSELSTSAGEIPDVIAWLSGAFSVLIECKVSRADFIGDAEKCFRRDEERGMGNERYFAAPKGIIKKEEIPKGWGLLEVEKNYVRELVSAEPKDANKHHECLMLVSALRRLEISTAVFVRQEIEDECRENLNLPTSAMPVSDSPSTQTGEAPASA